MRYEIWFYFFTICRGDQSIRFINVRCPFWLHRNFSMLQLIFACRAFHTKVYQAFLSSQNAKWRVKIAYTKVLTCNLDNSIVSYKAYMHILALLSNKAYMHMLALVSNKAYMHMLALVSNKAYMHILALVSNRFCYVNWVNHCIIMSCKVSYCHVVVCVKCSIVNCICRKFIC